MLGGPVHARLRAQSPSLGVPSIAASPKGPNQINLTSGGCLQSGLRLRGGDSVFWVASGERYWSNLLPSGIAVVRRGTEVAKRVVCPDPCRRSSHYRRVRHIERRSQKS